MREQIVELRNQGLTYKQICDTLGCCKSTVSYHLSEKVKISNRERNLNNINRLLSKKSSRFSNRNASTMKLRAKTTGFGRDQKRRSKANSQFGYHDVIDKFGLDTKCYLTGRNINLINDKYHFDHIIPTSKGGNDTIDNLGIVCREANMAKNDLTVEEFLNLCKEILEYNGYTISKRV